MSISRRVLLGLSAVVLMCGFSAQAQADVRGNSYDVLVRSFRNSFPDVFTFEAGIRRNSGKFIAEGGGEGEWEQTKYGPISVWTAYFEDEDFRVDFSGIQYEDLIFATGLSSEGTQFLITPPPEEPPPPTAAAY